MMSPSCYILAELRTVFMIREPESNLLSDALCTSISRILHLVNRRKKVYLSATILAVNYQITDLSCAGEVPIPCGRVSSGCIGPPGSSITQFGIPLDAEGRPLLRDGSGPVPGATGITEDGFIIGDPVALAAAANVPSVVGAGAPAAAPGAAGVLPKTPAHVTFRSF